MRLAIGWPQIEVEVAAGLLLSTVSRSGADRLRKGRLVRIGVEGSYLFIGDAAQEEACCNKSDDDEEPYAGEFFQVCFPVIH